jgi:hypothetical protein
MKLRLVATAAAATGVAVLIGHCLRTVQKQKPDLVGDSQELYRLPEGVKTTRDTAIGKMTLVTASGYYGGTAILVFLPKGFTFPIPMIEAFNDMTDGHFSIEASPQADAMISAGTDYPAYRRGEQGYWKDSSAPRLEETAGLLEWLIAQYQGQMAMANS